LIGHLHIEIPNRTTNERGHGKTELAHAGEKLTKEE